MDFGRNTKEIHDMENRIDSLDKITPRLSEPMSVQFYTIVYE